MTDLVRILLLLGIAGAAVTLQAAVAAAAQPGYYGWLGRPVDAAVDAQTTVPAAKAAKANIEAWTAAQQRARAAGPAPHLCCFICRRRFPTVANLERHVALSRLHTASMLARNAGDAPAALSAPATGTAAKLPAGFVDRAAERRRLFAELPRPPARMGRGEHDAAAPQPRQAPLPIPGSSKGAAILGAMGWVDGRARDATRRA